LKVKLPTGTIVYEQCYDAIAKALCHDLEETLTGDMPRDFKHSDPRLEEALSLAAGIAMRQSLDSLDLDPVVDDRFSEWWNRSKSPDVSGSIVAFADYLSVLSYLLQEKLDNNHSVILHLTAMREYYSEFSSNRYDFIRALIDETRPFMEELTHE
jgi:5'-deoxynucleotidase YfbR-like HD superfamily hydrolase